MDLPKGPESEPVKAPPFQGPILFDDTKDQEGEVGDGVYQLPDEELPGTDTVNIWKIRMSEKMAVIILKFEQCGFDMQYCFQDTNGMANSIVGPDQTTPSEFKSFKISSTKHQYSAFVCNKDTNRWELVFKFLNAFFSTAEEMVLLHTQA